jgi:hypothetical protein
MQPSLMGSVKILRDFTGARGDGELVARRPLCTHLVLHLTWGSSPLSLCDLTGSSFFSLGRVSRCRLR